MYERRRTIYERFKSQMDLLSNPNYKKRGCETREQVWLIHDLNIAIDCGSRFANELLSRYLEMQTRIFLEMMEGR